MVLENLDTDGNGTVEKNEFIDWLSKGLAMTPDQFERYMRSGDSQHLLAIFLLGVKLYCEIEYVEVEDNYSTLYISSQKYVVKKSLSKIKSLLIDKNFEQIQRKF